MSNEMQKTIEWQLAAGRTIEPLTFSELKGVPLSLVLEEISEILDAVASKDIEGIIDGIADTFVVCNALLMQCSDDLSVRNDKVIAEPTFVSQDPIDSLQSVKNALLEVQDEYSLVKLISLTINVAANFCVRLGADPVAALAAVNKTNFSKFASNASEAMYSVDSYISSPRYSNVHYVNRNGLYVIYGFINGLESSTPKILKAIGFTEPDHRNNVYKVKRATNNLENIQ